MPKGVEEKEEEKELAEEEEDFDNLAFQLLLHQRGGALFTSSLSLLSLPVL